ncbi:RNA polymerase sigma factor [Aliidongia dinghuensis]|uniref:RNA polymerase sigma factor n=1 Tax=Aliidongia dinghuensis TaxID=1867774 RepID=A0A8J2YV33_9PROT|nr:RNA polymerase sigma factor [Aliidongia dinghuensis]GGF20099.1 RNA polymerase sigma factor [Aliidongia dinghuensis]
MDFPARLLKELPRLHRYAIALVGNRAMAEDLVQDCAERALRYSGTLQDRSRIFGWLRTILYNLYMSALNEQRSRGTMVELEQTANSLAMSLPPGERTAAMDFVRAMNELSVEHREVLLLVGLEGLSYREVAATLDIPVGTVMSRLARARAQLRGRLELADGRPPSPSNGVPAGPSHSVETAED